MMPGRPDLLALSDQDLAGASNPLTLKRAKGDLEKGREPTLTQEGADLVAAWDDATCRFPAVGGLLAAACTCPARQTCLHRVRTVLYLQSRPGALGGSAPAEPESIAVTDVTPQDGPALPPRADLRELTDADLAGASNALTVTRAKKLISQGVTPAIAVDGDALVFGWPDATCRFPAVGGLLAAACTCPARQTCLHRVASVLYWQAQPAAAPIASSEPDPGVVAAPAPDPDPWTPARWSEAELQKIAGKALWKKATQALAEGLEVRQESSTAAEIPALGVRVRFLPDQPLEAALCTCGSRQLCLHRVAAALAWQELPAFVAELRPEEPALRARIQARVAELLAAGLDGLPPEAGEGLEALAQQARTVLPRPAENLDYLAGLIRDYHARSARFRPGTWLRSVGQLGAQIQALDAGVTHPALRGKARRSHLEAKGADLAGLGAEGFQSRTGSYLKCWFVLEQTGELVTASVGRSVMEGEPPPPGALWRTPLWGELPPAEVAGRCVRLFKARLSPDGTLGSSDTRAQLSSRRAPAPADLPEGLYAEGVAGLRALWRKQEPPIFRHFKARDLPAVVALAPGDPWAGPAVFSEIAQTLALPARLADGSVLLLRVKFGSGSQQLTDVLERTAHWRAAPTHLFVRFWLTPAGAAAVPVSAWLPGEEGPVSLGVGEGPLRTKGKPDVRLGALPADPEPLPLRRVRELLDLLESLSVEGLLRGARWRSRELRSAAAGLSRLDLPEAAAAVSGLADALAGASVAMNPDVTPAVTRFISLLAWATSMEEALVASD